MEKPNQTKALVMAGSKQKGRSAEVYASQLLSKPIIKAYLNKKSKELAEKCDITVESQIKETVKLRQAARESNHHTAALTANDQLNRHIGFYNADTSGGLSIVDIMAVVGINVEKAPERPVEGKDV
jgi:phage terminase small subunit